MTGIQVGTATNVRSAVASAPLIGNVPGVHLLELGHGWDVLRVPSGLGALALVRLRKQGQQLGPVLLDAPGQRFYFAVPIGSASYWERLPVRLLSVGSWLVVPNPWCAEEWFGGWCELPDDETLTDPGALRVALFPQRRGGFGADA